MCKKLHIGSFSKFLKLKNYMNPYVIKIMFKYCANSLICGK